MLVGIEHLNQVVNNKIIIIIFKRSSGIVVALKVDGKAHFDPSSISTLVPNTSSSIFLCDVLQIFLLIFLSNNCFTLQVGLMWVVKLNVGF